MENDLPVFRGYVSWKLKGTPTMPPSQGNKAIKMLLTTILLGGTIDSQDSRVLVDVMRHGNATSPGPTSMTSVTGRATYARPGLRPVNSKQLEEVRMGRVTSKIIKNHCVWLGGFFHTLFGRTIPQMPPCIEHITFIWRKLMAHVGKYSIHVYMDVAGAILESIRGTPWKIHVA